MTPPYSAASREPAPASRNRLAEVEEGYGTRRRVASPPLRCPGSPPLLFLRATSSAGLTNALSGIHSHSCHEKWYPARAGTIGPVQRPEPARPRRACEPRGAPCSRRRPRHRTSPALSRTARHHSFGELAGLVASVADRLEAEGVARRGPGRARGAELGRVRRRLPGHALPRRRFGAAEPRRRRPRSSTARSPRSSRAPALVAGHDGIAGVPAVALELTGSAAAHPAPLPAHRPPTRCARADDDLAVLLFTAGTAGCAAGGDAHARQPRRRTSARCSITRACARAGRRRARRAAALPRLRSERRLGVGLAAGGSVALVDQFDATRAVDIVRSGSGASRCSPECRRCTRHGSRSTT